MNAHNVKIITAKGVVTLRGPVKTSEEKASIGTWTWRQTPYVYSKHVQCAPHAWGRAAARETRVRQ